MKSQFVLILSLVLSLLLSAFSQGITHEVIQLFQPLSLHGTDGAGRFDDTEEALQAEVLPRPYVSSGALPEDLVDAIGLSHRMPTNSVSYEVEEANLLILCGVKLSAEIVDKKLVATMDISQLKIPDEIDLTGRQILKLTIISIRKTLAAYFGSDAIDTLLCEIRITGFSEDTATYTDLATEFIAGE